MANARKLKRRGPKPTVKHPGYHTVYLDRETWKWLMKRDGGASSAIRNLVAEEKRRELFYVTQREP